MNTLQIIHWVAAFIVMAEALNKMERTAPFASGLTVCQRIVDLGKATAWLLMALGAGGALIAPLMEPMRVQSPVYQSLAHTAPSLAEVCMMGGFALLIIRTRFKEG